jgi:hypothetical protein
MKDFLSKAWNIILGFFLGKDMKALYWYTFAQFIAAAGDIMIQNLTDWNPDNIITVAAGLVISRITKKLNSKVPKK